MQQGWFMGMATVLSLGALGCSEQPAKMDRPVVAAATPPTVVAGQDHAFDERLLEIAGSYQQYHRVCKDLQITIQPCAFAPINQFNKPTLVQFSASTDSSTHGRKLYYLYAKQLPAKALTNADYYEANGKNAVGQAVVKEAWLPEEVRDEEKKPRETTIMKDGHRYYPASKTGLFIMFKMDPQTPGTDEGWVYGTTTADGKTVTSSGRVPSCMGCHQEAPHDRLFGLPKK